MNTTRLRFLSLAFAALGWPLACDSDPAEQSSSSTHWVTCDTDADCAPHPSHPECSDGYCIDSEGQRLAVDGTGGRSSAPISSGGAGTGGALPANSGGSGGDVGGSPPASSAGSGDVGGTPPASSGGSSDVGGAPPGGTGGSAGGSAGEGGNAGEGDAGSGGSNVDEGSACTGPEPFARPDLDKACESSSDCFAGRHLLDCCGSIRWLSYNVAARADFERAEAGCVPTCPCPSSPTRTEDGVEIGNEEAIPECVDGTCVARHPDTVGDCLEPGGCIDLDTASCIDADGPVGNGVCRGAGGFCFLCECAAPDTPIATPHGDVAISELRVGDLVYSIDGAAIRAVPLAATHQNPVQNHQVVKVRLASGEVLELSAAHPIADGRTFADLAAGARLGDTRVASTTRAPYSHPFTYDILPDSDTGTYFAHGVALGSTLWTGRRSPRSAP